MQTSSWKTNRPPSNNPEIYKIEFELHVVVHVCNPSNQETEQKACYKFKTSLGYVFEYRSDQMRATSSDSVSPSSRGDDSVVKVLLLKV